jgi:D-glycero-D-manno-heptose 1,7-bisphosphate phosphatase
MKPALFLDRDGVINEDFGYLYQIEEIKWIPGIIETIQYFKRKGYYVIVLTNQSGIARGYYQEDDVLRLHTQMKSILEQSNAVIDKFYFCPHHPEAIVKKYRMECSCRKPGTGMVQQALRDYPIELDHSFLIGDQKSDIELAENLGIRGYQFRGGNLFNFLNRVVLKLFEDSSPWHFHE